MYYGSGTVAHTASQSHHMRRARGLSQNDVMAAILKIWRHIQNPLISTDARNNPDKVNPDRIWNDGASDFFEQRRPNKKKNDKNKMSSDMGSVTDLKCNSIKDIIIQCNTRKV